MRTAVRWTRRLAAALLAAAAALGAAELGARVALPPPEVNGWMVADPLLGYRMPGHHTALTADERGVIPFSLNSLGFPGPELPDGPPPAGTERVLLVGDSFLNSWQVRDEDWVGSVLRAELAPGPAEVFALSSDDYGTAQELLLLRRHAGRVAPTTVVLLVFTGNDVINDSPALAGRTGISPGDWFRPYLVDDGEGELELTYASPWRARLRSSRLFSLAEARWLARRGDAAALRAELAGERVASAVQRARAGRLPDEQYELFRAPEPGSRWDRAWRDTETVLLAFRREVAALDARFVVAVIPSIFQVQEDAAVLAHDELIGRRGGPALGAQLDWNAPERRLEELFHREEIEHVMLLGALRRRLAETREAVYRRDGHLDGRGHALMGKRIAARLAAAAADECFAPGEDARPVQLARLYPPDALDVDFVERPCLELVGWGFGHWQRRADGGMGWPLTGRGLVLVPRRAGSVELRGVLLPGAELPARLAASVAYGRTIAELALERAGELVFSVPLPAPDGRGDWLPLFLELHSGEGGATAGLALTGMRYRP